MTDADLLALKKDFEAAFRKAKIEQSKVEKKYLEWPTTEHLREADEARGYTRGVRAALDVIESRLTVQEFPFGAGPPASG